jgi:hypothetical protein
LSQRLSPAKNARKSDMPYFSIARRNKKIQQIDSLKGFWHQACKEIIETDN